MTASAQNFLSTITANASFLRLPLESQSLIQAHAARFGQITPPAAKAAAIAAGRTGHTMSLIRQGREILASQQATASTATSTMTRRTATPGEFRALSGYDRGVFVAA